MKGNRDQRFVLKYYIHFYDNKCFQKCLAHLNKEFPTDSESHMINMVIKVLGSGNGAKVVLQEIRPMRLHYLFLGC